MPTAMINGVNLYWELTGSGRGAVLFLASEAARHITGAVLDVNGGQAMA